jgi:GntR family transcriptional regulator, transcriptional repressor for pyruvate dehydrogenase complex
MTDGFTHPTPKRLELALASVAAMSYTRVRLSDKRIAGQTDERSELHRPVSRRNTYELIAQNVLELIGDGHLRPGDPLPTERELTEAYGVGRSSVREALRILESKGVIEPNGKGGFAVAAYGNPLNRSLEVLLTLREGDLRELFEVRRIFEVELAALAAASREGEHLTRMATAIDEMVEGVGDGDRYIGADIRFHLTIAEATGNRVAQHTMLAIRELLRQALRTIYQIPRSAEQSIDDHRAILAAITDRDSEAAREAMREHLDRVEADVQETLGVSAQAPGRSKVKARG